MALSSEVFSDWYVEELFLNACVPAVHSILRRRSLNACYACRSGFWTMTHDCQKDYDAVVTILLPECLLFLDTKRYKVLKRMNRLLETDGEHYGDLSALDVLQFLGSDIDDPFKRIAFDKNWRRRLKTKVIEDSQMIFPTRPPTVEKPPTQIELIVNDLTADM